MSGIRSTMLFFLLASVLSLLGTCAAAAVHAAPAELHTLHKRAPIEADPSLRLLTPGNFTRQVAHGMWFVEFFSPWCGHCQAFAPTWKDLVGISQHLEESSQFYLARVDCVASGDLCVDQDVQAYPTIQLYQDGEKIDQWKGERSFAKLKTYVDGHAEAYRQQRVLLHKAEEEEKAKKEKAAKSS